MLSVLAGGYVWLRPSAPPNSDGVIHFVERAAQAGCLNIHSKPQLSDKFANIMPWLSSVGAAAAAADYDGDGAADLYVTNSGRGQSNRLFHNKGDGTFQDGVAYPTGTGPDALAMKDLNGDAHGAPAH